MIASDWELGRAGQLASTGQPILRESRSQKPRDGRATDERQLDAWPRLVGLELAADHGKRVMGRIRGRTSSGKA